jgi:succinylglutamate desuccinylase
MSSGVSGVDGCCEDVELNELDSMLDSILVTAEDEVYVLDLHSTSADGKPFATVGDTLRNRRFAQRFPVTMLLGIEEQLNGTMLEYLNNAGAVTLGFEGGSHMSPRTADTHEALVWLALHNAGILNSEDIPDLERYRELLARGERGATVYEVRYRHAIRHDDDFVMTPGFNNFDPITSGQVVAMDRNGFVRANQTGLLLMPLYQKLGDDGFFIGRRVASVWLWISELLRTLGVQNMIHILPGVNRDPDDPETLVVNTSVARLFPLQIFHLLGFRRRRWSNRKLIVSRRKHDSISPFIHSYR